MRFCFTMAACGGYFQSSYYLIHQTVQYSKKTYYPFDFWIMILDFILEYIFIKNTII